MADEERFPAPRALHDRLSGQGFRTVAIVDAYGYPNAERDLGIYRAQWGLSSCTTANGCLRIINQTGGTALPRLVRQAFAEAAGGRPGGRGLIGGPCGASVASRCARSRRADRAVFPSPRRLGSPRAPAGGSLPGTERRRARSPRLLRRPQLAEHRAGRDRHRARVRVIRRGRQADPLVDLFLVSRTQVESEFDHGNRLSGI